MAPKKQVYITAELDWAEEQLASWKAYIDANPLNELQDRIKWKETKSGGTMPMVVASIESQIKSIRDTMKEYLALLSEVNKMREIEAQKEKEVRGGGDVPYRMRTNQ
jgi:hypothetical protein